MKAEVRKMKRRCEGKVAYHTSAAASHGGQSDFYRCKKCGKWHRASDAQTLLARVRGMQLRPDGRFS